MGEAPQGHYQGQPQTGGPPHQGEIGQGGIPTEIQNNGDRDKIRSQVTGSILLGLGLLGGGERTREH